MYCNMLEFYYFRQHGVGVHGLKEQEAYARQGCGPGRRLTVSGYTSSKMLDLGANFLNGPGSEH